jgi:hypothetical protein
MTISVNIDGWPYKVTFSGTIDIGRMNGTDDVGFRISSDDGKVFTVEVDEEAVKRRQELLKTVFDRMGFLFWHGLEPVVRFTPKSLPWEGL